MDLEKKLEELVLKHLPDERYYLTEIVARPAGSKTKISVFMDGDDGISIDTCAQVSRQVGKELDELDLLKHPYTLMVSSPGLDRPLKLPRQYHKNIGKVVKINLKNDVQKSGTLKQVGQEFVIIEETLAGQGKTKEEKLLFSEIDKTHVLVTFK